MTWNWALETRPAKSDGLRQSLERLGSNPERSGRVSGTRGVGADGPKFELKALSIGVRTVLVVATPLTCASCSCTAAPGRLGDSGGPIWMKGISARMLS